jgi:hypothetical protein
LELHLPHPWLHAEGQRDRRSSAAPLPWLLTEGWRGRGSSAASSHCARRRPQVGSAPKPQ